MFCPKCGNQLVDSAEFCSNCGNRLSSGADQPAPEKKKNSSGKKGRIAGIVLFVIGVLAFINSATSGTLTDFSSISAVASLILKIALVAGGGYLFYKNKDK